MWNLLYINYPHTETPESLPFLHAPHICGSFSDSEILLKLNLFCNVVLRTKRAAVFRSRCKRLSCCLQEAGAPLKGAQHYDTH